VPGLDIVLPIQVTRIEKATPLPQEVPDETTHSAGYAAGYEEGRLRAEWEGHRKSQQNDVRIKALVNTLEKLHSEYESLLAEHLPDLIHGALNRVFRQHPFTAAEISAEIIALLHDMGQAGRIALECSPTEFDQLRHLLEDCVSIPDDSKWTLEGNPALVAGEFILKSDLGDVDGRHSSRIRQIHHALEATS